MILRKMFGGTATYSLGITNWSLNIHLSNAEKIDFALVIFDRILN